ncbi:sigma factor-like helix-turn-helix DNA-binding protein [Neobacillus vireti]|uniref:RNA polymerase sigma-70 region 4 domain-containing protein n=1 Tax=Neobacillus vireti LMG 21834 TaxID=1131730 RepID=A0AB94IU20_9BACI|nr:sigma factor-like helix-turn-helix DNA-binding protein [Neobacillus vireti]ETI70555.1 hypothetical protein BAVI_01774 [Neobacillus vireti LMG 21834]KLT18408.1 hypothetical protein AA980_08805 [Neobacillus vireti]
MDTKNKITRNDEIFYLDMIGRNKEIHALNPYYKILEERNSDDFKRFIGIYTVMREFLSEREQIILNEIYGVNKQRVKLKAVGEMLNICPERVRQIRRKAEFKIARKISEILKNDTY